MISGIRRQCNSVLGIAFQRSFSSTTANNDVGVVVGMSGGVDSSVAALLLKRQGFDVTGVYMRNWDASDEFGQEECPAEDEYKDVQRVCEQIGVPCQRVDFVQSYWNRVFSPSLNALEDGFTPNPDILCNREIKFKEFQDYALTSLGADYVATGHYAKVRQDMESQSSLLFAGDDANKDQSYFLCSVPGSAFNKAMFPIGDMEKVHVRKIAEEAGLCTALKKDSVGICFIGKRKFSDFIQGYIANEPGKIISIEDGQELGRHRGLSTYTIGQGARLSGMNKKWYVTRKNMRDNTLYVSPGKMHPSLFSDSLYVEASSFNWIFDQDFHKLQAGEVLRCNYRVRYRQPLGQCSVQLIRSENSHCQQRPYSMPTDEFMLQVDFDIPQRAVTPQQTLALYRSDGLCYGGGPIWSAGPNYFDLNKPLPPNATDWSCS